MTVTAMDLARAAKARSLVRLVDGRTGVLLFYPVKPGDGRPARLRLSGGRHQAVPADEVLEVIDNGTAPAWAVHERLLTLVRLLGEQGDPRAPADSLLLQLHTPGHKVCKGCQSTWPCEEAHDVGDRRGFYWS